MIEWLGEKGIGHAKVQYKLRDWVFSRQRYWGEPIPIVKCDKCGYVALPEDQLPLELPNVNQLRADRQRRVSAGAHDRLGKHHLSVLRRSGKARDRYHAAVGRFLLVLPALYGPAQRQGACLARKHWNTGLPVDWYNGGMEHTTLHLLYSRFWHKFLYDIGVVPTKEPYAKRTSHGMILGENGEKMSKSRGNVVNPGRDR